MLVQLLLVRFGSMIGVPVCKFWKPNVTHVIAATDAKGSCTRTLKVLMAILNGNWVLKIDCKLTPAFFIAHVQISKLFGTFCNISFSVIPLLCMIY